MESVLSLITHGPMSPHSSIPRDAVLAPDCLTGLGSAGRSLPRAEPRPGDLQKLVSLSRKVPEAHAPPRTPPGVRTSPLPPRSPDLFRLRMAGNMLDQRRDGVLCDGAWYVSYTR